MLEHSASLVSTVFWGHDIINDPCQSQSDRIVDLQLLQEKTALLCIEAAFQIRHTLIVPHFQWRVQSDVALPKLLLQYITARNENINTGCSIGLFHPSYYYR